MKGVNLGGWLVLEKWICGDPFAKTSAEDTGELYEQLPWEEITTRLKRHWDSFIQKSDLEWIACSGCDLVRLPVPYTMFGDILNQAGCVEYVDRLFGWAEEYGLKVLLDLHTVPGGQNGLDNSGTTGLCTWHFDPAKVEWTLTLLERIARRYCGSRALFGIELLNEPISEVRFRSLCRRLDARYENRLKQSSWIPTDFLVRFYEEAYHRLTPLLKPEHKIVIQDGFRLGEWKDYLPKEQFPQLWIDTHLYLNFMASELTQNKSSEYVQLIFSKFEKELAEAERYHPVIVGEWTVAHKPEDAKSMTAEQYRLYMRGATALQQMAFEHAHGWIYFNYRVDDPGRPNWDYRFVCQQGILEV